MELAFLVAYWLIIRALGDTIGNTASLLQGRPVRVRRTVHTGPGTTGQLAGPSYTGRALGTVAAVAKESLVSGVRSGWAIGKARHEARVAKRAAKRAAKKAARARTAPESTTASVPVDEQATAPVEMGPPPVLHTEPAQGGSEDPDGTSEAGRRSLWELLEDNEPVDPADGRPRWLLRQQECQVPVDSAGTRCGRPSAPDSWLRMCAEHQAEDLARERPVTYATPMGTRERLVEAGRCWYEATPGRGFCGRKAAAGSAEGLCLVHDPDLTGGVPVLDVACPGMDCGSCGRPPAEHCAVCRACLGRHTPGCPAHNERSDHDQGEQGGQRATVLYLLPGGRSKRSEQGDDEPQEVSPEPDTAPERRVQASPPPPTFGGVMSTTVSGEVTTIGATRAYLSQLGSYVDDILSQLELAQATLRGQELDSTTLGHMATAAEHFAAAKAALEQARAALDSQHSLMEEAVQSTPHAAQRDYYRE